MPEGERTETEIHLQLLGSVPREGSRVPKSGVTCLMRTYPLTPALSFALGRGAKARECVKAQACRDGRRNSPRVDGALAAAVPLACPGPSLTGEGRCGDTVTKGH